MSAPIATAAPQTPTRAMIATLGLTAALCGLVIVTAFEGTLPAVEANRKIALERAVKKVIPTAATIVPFHAAADGSVARAAGGAAPAGTIAFHAAYAADGALIGIAAEGSGKGYADNVRILFAYTPACACVTGMAVVAMRETPGIGDKIITDRAFLKNFEQLDARLNGDLSALANAIVTVKHGAKTAAWQLDAISGATITSRAVGRAINDTAQALLPRLVPRLQSIAQPGDSP